MTTTIVLPAHAPAVAELEATAAASVVTTGLRAAGTATSDVSEATSARGAPADWSGDAAEAASHAMTRFGRAADAATTAFTRVSAACDLYAEKVVELISRRDRLVERSSGVNADIDALRTHVQGSTGDDIAALQAEADALRGRADHLHDDVVAFWADVRAAEDALIAAFEAVDTVREGADSAARDTTDIAALRAELTALGGDTDGVNAWWKGLTDAEREALKISDPDLIGNTNGIPTGDRDEANRTSLDRDLDQIGSTPEDERTTAEQRLLDRAIEAENGLAIPAADDHPEVDTHLLVYQPGAFGGDGAVAVSYGDPDTADNTAVIVPGITNDASTIAGQGRDAYTLHQQAIRNGESAATIAWMGYDAPSWNPESAVDWPGDGLDMGSVVTEGRAEDGGRLLADFVDGLRSTDEGERSHLSVIGHSYGSTTAAHAAHDWDIDADSLTLIGSPGAGGDDVDHVSDLDMDPGRVYIGSADNDFVTWLGRDGDLGMGRDPSQADFGATRFGVEDGPEFRADDLGQGIANHTSYFDPETNQQSLDNLAAIVRGDEPDEIDGRAQDANDMALDWAKDEVVDQVVREIETTIEEASEAYDDSTDWVGDRWDDFSGSWR
jgi:pimeloyl-ACP methyl ester carboxylesterase